MRDPVRRLHMRLRQPVAPLAPDRSPRDSIPRRRPGPRPPHRRRGRRDDPAAGSGPRDLRVERKPDRTPVTDADVAVEDEVRRLLAAERPDDAVLGEERGGEAGRGRAWIVDPIDGTKNFSRGVPVFATLLALVVDGDAGRSGVVSAPALGRRWWAARGLGAFTSDVARGIEAAPISVSGRVATSADAYVSTTDLDYWREHRHPGPLARPAPARRGRAGRSATSSTTCSSPRAARRRRRARGERLGPGRTRRRRARGRGPADRLHRHRPHRRRRGAVHQRAPARRDPGHRRMLNRGVARRASSASTPAARRGGSTRSTPPRTASTTTARRPRPSTRPSPRGRTPRTRSGRRRRGSRRPRPPGDQHRRRRAAPAPRATPAAHRLPHRFRRRRPPGGSACTGRRAGPDAG